MPIRYLFYIAAFFALFLLIAGTSKTFSQIHDNIDYVIEKLQLESPPKNDLNFSNSLSNTEALRNAKESLSRWLFLSALLVIGLLFFLATPFTLQHFKNLNEIRSTNLRLKNQAATLRATHRTIDNMLEDIIHEKKQTSRTTEINARLASIINSAEDAIFSLNMAGYITTANEAAFRVFGESCEGKSFFTLFPSKTSTHLKALLLTTAEQNSGSTLDITLEKNRQRIDLSLTISPIHSESQDVIGFSVIAKDISNTKLEEERFRLAVEAAPNAMIMVNHRSEIVLVNSEAESMFGHTREELFGQPIHHLVPPNLRTLHHFYVEKYLESPDRRRMGNGFGDLYGQRKNGELFPIEVGLTPINVDKETYIISSIVDISERIQQQQALKNLNHELRRKNQEMEQFIYTVSHDLKAPLVTIAGFANRLKAEDIFRNNSNHLHKIDRIIANVKSMEALLQDLLHLSRIIKRDLEKTRIDTTKTLQHVLDSLEGDVKIMNANIEILGPLPKINAQESLLFQCIQNIISNALKYSRSGIKPVIKVSAVYESGHSGLRISDNGIGIAEQHQERIFNVFERLHPEIAEGTGVGLSIVKTIMEKHDGKITLESQINQGTTFTLLFPDAM